MKVEKIITPFNGYLTVFLAVLAVLAAIYGASTKNIPVLICAIPIAIILAKGLTIVSPNSSKVRHSSLQSSWWFYVSNRSVINCLGNLGNVLRPTRRI